MRHARSEYPRSQSFGERRAQRARFGEAGGLDGLGRQDRLGRLRGGIHDQRIGDAFQPPAGRDAVELALGVLAVRARADDRRIGAAFEPSRGTDNSSGRTSPSSRPTARRDFRGRRRDSHAAANRSAGVTSFAATSLAVVAPSAAARASASLPPVRLCQAISRCGASVMPRCLPSRGAARKLPPKQGETDDAPIDRDAAGREPAADRRRAGCGERSDAHFAGGDRDAPAAGRPARHGKCDTRQARRDSGRGHIGRGRARQCGTGGPIPFSTPSMAPIR